MARKTYTFAKVKGFRRFLSDLPEDVRIALIGRIEVVNEDIADEARRRATAQGGVAALVAPSIKAIKGKNPTVRMGSRKKLPRSGNGWARARKGKRQTIGDVVFGAEFGGGGQETTPDGGSTLQFKPHRGNEGFFLFPTVRENMGRIVDACADAIPLGVDEAVT